MEIYFNTYNDTSSCTYQTVSFHRRSQGGDKGSIIIVITMLENLSGLLWLFSSFDFKNLLQFFIFKTTYKVVPHFGMM